MASFRVFIKPSAVKEIEAIDGKPERRRVAARIENLANDPRPPAVRNYRGKTNTA